MVDFLVYKVPLVSDRLLSFHLMLSTQDDEQASNDSLHLIKLTLYTSTDSILIDITVQNIVS